MRSSDGEGKVCGGCQRERTEKHLKDDGKALKVATLVALFVSV